jgi:hypothetical protein
MLNIQKYKYNGGTNGGTRVKPFQKNFKKKYLRFGKMVLLLQLFLQRNIK